MNKAGASAKPLYGPDGKEIPAATGSSGSGSMPAAPLNNALGSQNAFLSISHEIARPSVTSAIATVSSGWRPFEPVVFNINGGAASYFLANDQGALFVSITTGSALGENWLQLHGLWSGKSTGGSFRISATAPLVPGMAVGAHSVIPGSPDSFFVFGSRYPASVGVTIARNDTSLGTGTTTAAGLTPIFGITTGAGPDGSAVYNFYVTAAPTGTLSGQIVEERADAGPPGSPLSDRSLSRAFVDRPVVSSTITTTLALVGEGFAPGENVNLTLLPGFPLATGVAGSEGSVFFMLKSPPADTNYNLRLDGASSARVAYATIMADPKVQNIPSSIVSPSRANGVPNNVTYLLTRFTPGMSGFVLADGVGVGSTSTDADGNGAVLVPKPMGAGRVVHSLAFVETVGTESGTGPVLLAGTGTISGTIRDATSNALIKGTVRVSNFPDAVRQNNLPSGGVYSMTLPIGTYNVTVTGSGCYYPATFTNVAVTADTTTPLNVTLARNATDAFGYSCYDNAGASYIPATNVVISGLWDDNVASLTLPFPVNLYGSVYTTATLSSNGWLGLGIPDPGAAPARTNTGLPNSGVPNNILAVNWDDLQALTAAQGVSPILTDVIGISPNRTFIVEWRDARHFGATVVNNIPVSNTFELHILENATASPNDIFMVYPTFNTGSSTAADDGRDSSVGIENLTGTIGKQHQFNTGSGVANEATNYLWAGNSIRFFAGAVSTPTPTFTAGPTGTATATPDPCSPTASYRIDQTAGTLVPGTILVPLSQSDDTFVNIPIPFTYNFYGQPFTSVNASTNGYLFFTGATETRLNVCLPTATVNNVILPFWDDLLTNQGGGTQGIYTSIQGLPGSQILTIEWRACLYNLGLCLSNGDANFEVRLYENQDRFDIVYGTMGSSPEADLRVAQQARR